MAVSSSANAPSVAMCFVVVVLPHIADIKLDSTTLDSGYNHSPVYWDNLRTARETAWKGRGYTARFERRGHQVV
jgi:hypothetical protein